ncbi:hypothetical protein D3C71_1556110 [compost metagenome]
MDHLQKMSAAGFTGMQIAVRRCRIAEDRHNRLPCVIITADHVAGSISGAFHPAGCSGIHEPDAGFLQPLVAGDGLLVMGIAGLDHNIAS